MAGVIKIKQQKPLRSSVWEQQSIQPGVQGVIVPLRSFSLDLGAQIWAVWLPWALGLCMPSTAWGLEQGRCFCGILCRMGDIVLWEDTEKLQDLLLLWAKLSNLFPFGLVFLT